MTDLTQLTASELSNLYQSGAASPVTVAEQVLAKIERLNPVLNAFCFTDPETTLKQARASEYRWQAGQPLSPLDGVPVAVKDSILTQGWPTLNGSLTVDPNQPWLEDAPMVAQLREAGAMFVGKTTMPEFSSTVIRTVSQRYGITVNPWNIKCSPGGSSGGSAAAVAAGLVPVSVGTDLSGSIAVPGAFCGVFGYKPSAGKLAHSPRDTLNLGSVGVFARSVTDLIIITNAASAPDVRDWFHVPSDQIQEDINSQHKFLRVGWSTTNSEDTEIYAEITHILTKIQNLWQTQTTATLQQFNLPPASLPSAGKIISNILPYVLHSFTKKPNKKTAMLSNDSTDLYHWLTHRFEFNVLMNQSMQEFDAIIVPATGISAANVPCDFISEINTMIVSPWSNLCTLNGLPSVTVPVGVGDHGLPMAVMVIGQKYGDSQVLQVASIIQKLFPMPVCPVVL